ncbi:response regulator [Flavobacterium sp. WC2509]|uniref:response regulator n=1 Tax=Flavobacterium sp. WC2509 TaxID=3461406 RepID=UPI004044E50A
MDKKILIVDDHFIVRSGITFLLEKEFNDVSVTEADSFEGALSVCSRIIFDLVILDINLHDGRKIDMINDLRELQKEVKILIFSAYEEDIYAFRYIQAGANGYLNKFSDSSTTIEAIRTVLKLGKYITSNTLDKFIAFSQDRRESTNIIEVLTPRELEIAEFLVKGYGNIEVANELNLKMTTVSTHKLNIFKKLKVSNVIELFEMFKKVET